MKGIRWLTAVAAALCMAGAAHAQSPAPGDTLHRYTGPLPARTPARYYTGFGWTRHNLDAPVITRVREGSPAARAGLMSGDVLIAVDGQAMAERAEFFPGGAPGRRYTLQVRRGDEELQLEIVLDPPQPRAAG
jgi:S1-C subfamily serine protease